MDTTTTRSSMPSPADLAARAVSGTHAAIQSLAGTADEFARKASPAISDVEAMAHRAVDRAADATAPAAEWLAQSGDRLVATERKLVADTCSYVSAHPWKSLGMAAAAGFLLSRLIR